jgi:hypothetical protein
MWGTKAGSKAGTQAHEAGAGMGEGGAIRGAGIDDHAGQTKLKLRRAAKNSKSETIAHFGNLICSENAAPERHAASPLSAVPR